MTENEEVLLLASLLFTKEEIKIIQTAEDDLKNFDDAFKKGKLQGEYDIRNAIFTQAKNGSVPAQNQWIMLKRELSFNE